MTVECATQKDVKTAPALVLLGVEHGYTNFGGPDYDSDVDAHFYD